MAEIQEFFVFLGKVNCLLDHFAFCMDCYPWSMPKNVLKNFIVFNQQVACCLVHVNLDSCNVPCLFYLLDITRRGSEIEPVIHQGFLGHLPLCLQILNVKCRGFCIRHVKECCYPACCSCLARCQEILFVSKPWLAAVHMAVYQAGQNYFSLCIYLFISLRPLRGYFLYLAIVDKDI